MKKHLHTKQNPPSEYVEMLLIERFGVGILDLPDEKVQSYLACWDEESKFSKWKAKNK